MPVTAAPHKAGREVESEGTARNGNAIRKPRCTKKQLLERIAVALEEIATQMKIKNQARAADAHWRRDA